MMTMTGIAILLLILLVGFIKLRNSCKNLQEALKFATNYREQFHDLAIAYFQSMDRYSDSGSLNGEKYEWLTKNVEKIQRRLGMFGIIDYTAPFNKFRAPRYEVVINTIPKFRDGTVKEHDANWVDDCLLRYIGHNEEIIEERFTELRNPFIWFREGVQFVVSIPFYALNWFGVISERRLDGIIRNTFFKVGSGIVSIVAFMANLVTIFGTWGRLIHFIKQSVGLE